MATRATGKPVRRVNVGLDFGTSTTKVVVRIEKPTGEGEFLIVGPCDVQRTVLFPSTVAVLDRALVFGARAERSASPVRARSFKMNLPAEAGSRQHAWRGTLRLGNTGLSAEDLSTLYLAWVLNDVMAQVKQYVRADLNIWINSAAPLDQIESEPQLQDLFQRIVFRALKIAPLARHPWGLAEAQRALAQARSLPIPAQQDSPVTVFPETHAAMTSHMLLPGRRKGNYATVDVGAGSTDVAFFWFHATEGQPEMCYYGARSEFVGMDDVDRANVAGNGVSPEQARDLRERAPTAGAQVPPEVSAAFDSIYKCYGDGFRRSYDRCRGEFEWRQPDGRAKYTLALVGGGSLCDQLVSRLKQALPWCNMTSVNVDVLRVPDDLPVLKVGKPQPISRIAPGEQTLLLLAYGLSNRAVEIPRYETGHRYVRVRPVGERPSHEELYAK